MTIAVQKTGGIGRLDRSAEPIGQPSEAPHWRAATMAETMREILFRDGNVTEAALVGEGYSASEIVEHAEEARKIVGLVMAVASPAVRDRLPEVIEKAIAGEPARMPFTAGMAETPALCARWQDYCNARAAHKLDPWLSQSERCLHRLKAFLILLPLLDRERNRVVLAVAAALKGQVSA